MLEHFLTLTCLLLKYESIWKEAVFSHPELSPLKNFPNLAKYFDTLSEAELLVLQTDNNLLFSSVKPFFEDASLLETLTSITHAKKHDQHPPKFWDTDIPGRKAEQILAFTQALGNIETPILEWCCGKQHLGRLLSQMNQQCSEGLEIDLDLVAKANMLSNKQKQDSCVITQACDVLSLEAMNFLKPKQHAVALHACGGLHVRLLEACIKQEVQHISLSPCCYHRFNPSKQYQPLSKAGKNNPLKLHEDNLRLATRETKTASPAETENRRRLQAWRLGFDIIQRELRKEDSYLEIPSMPSSIAKQSFPHFCEHAANLKELKLPEEMDFKHYESIGFNRLHQYERAELFRMLFRRALEVWLALDKALYLQENGYDVELGLFCSSTITPRNILIQAKRV